MRLPLDEPPRESTHRKTWKPVTATRQCCRLLACELTQSGQFFH
jgi:hypothetical protein